MPKKRCSRRVQAQPTDAASPGLQRRMLQKLRQRDSECEGGQSEIGARQSGRWPTEEEAEKSADCHDRGHGDIEGNL